MVLMLFHAFSTRSGLESTSPHHKLQSASLDRRIVPDRLRANTSITSRVDVDAGTSGRARAPPAQVFAATFNSTFSAQRISIDANQERNCPIFKFKCQSTRGTFVSTEIFT